MAYLAGPQNARETPHTPYVALRIGGPSRGCQAATWNYLDDSGAKVWIEPPREWLTAYGPVTKNVSRTGKGRCGPRGRGVRLRTPLRDGGGAP